MAKLLLLIALAVVIAMWWFGKGRPRGTSSSPSAPGATPARPPAMVACAQCGMHLPASESVEGEGGRAYCCAEHRRLGPAR